MRTINLETSEETITIESKYFKGRAYAGTADGIDFILIASDDLKLSHIAEDIIGEPPVDFAEVFPVIVAQDK